MPMLYFNNSYPHQSFAVMAFWQVNPIDIIMGIVFFTIIFSGYKNTFLAEGVKFVGSFIAVLVSFHYYASLGTFIKNEGFAPEGLHDFFALLVIAGTIILSFSIIQSSWCAVFNVTTVEKSASWRANVCNVLKSYLMCGILVTAMLCSGSKPLVYNVVNSAGVNFWGRGTASLYHYSYRNVFAFVFPTEKPNKNLFGLYKIPFEEEKADGGEAL